MINILLVDEYPSVRRGVRMRLALEADFAVLGEAGDGWDALALAREFRPDVLVSGVRLPGLDGLLLTKRLQQDLPTCAMIILSLYDDQPTRRRAAQAGAVTFISKQDPSEALVAAIRAAASRRPHPLT
jgi:DNA-binding NarL/FixJ family response regulator